MSVRSNLAEYSEPFNLGQLRGAVLTGYLREYSFLTLQTLAGSSITVSTVEHLAGYWFEVFPLRVLIEPQGADSRSSQPLLFRAPLEILSVHALWRSEWILEGAVGESCGSNTKTQCAGRGPVPAEAVASARVMAGLLIQGASDERLIIRSSPSAPFEIEMAVEAEVIERMLAGFEPVETGSPSAYFEKPLGQSSSRPTSIGG